MCLLTYARLCVAVIHPAHVQPEIGCAPGSITASSITGQTAVQMPDTVGVGTIAHHNMLRMFALQVLMLALLLRM